jgi:poly(A) polymerase
MKIAPEWLRTDALQFILGELSIGGHSAYCVGGCVRDAILGLPVSDIDIATSRTPEDVEKVFTGWNDDIKLIPTGVEHGTWTIMVGEEGFEVTTFRFDVDADGRHTDVAFTTSVSADAQRRDFTMNALYMDWTGDVIDPTGKGLSDLYARQVRFVGRADERCREDYLRILRLFRFHAKYGKGPMDPDAFQAARHCALGLTGISGERKWAELKKLLACHDPMDALRDMDRSGVLSLLLPRHGHTANVSDVMDVERQAGMEPGWQRRLVALMGYDEDDVQMPFPVSNAEQDYLTKLAQYYPLARRPAHAAYKLNNEVAAEDCCVLQTSFSRDEWCDPKASIARGLGATLPVKAADFIQLGVPQGPELGACLRDAERRFVLSDLQATKIQIMDRARLPV